MSTATDIPRYVSKSPMMFVADIVGVFIFFLILMTRLERKTAELEKLYEWRRTFLRQNAILSMHRTQAKIDALEKEIIEMKKYEPQKLSNFLDGKGEETKNRIYKAMLRISLLADVVNEACEEAADVMKTELGVVDFSLRKEVAAMRDLSQKIASFVLFGNKALEDFLIDDEIFVDMCMKHADAHLKRKLKLK